MYFQMIHQLHNLCLVIAFMLVSSKCQQLFKHSFLRIDLGLLVLLLRAVNSRDFCQLLIISSSESVNELIAFFLSCLARLFVVKCLVFNWCVEGSCFYFELIILDCSTFKFVKKLLMVIVNLLTRVYLFSGGD